MRLPFTVEQFLGVFRAYNDAVWPAQWALLLAAVTAIAFALRPGGQGGAVASGILAALWLWMGAVYHLGFFRAINPAAAAFGALFVVQAGLLAWLGVRQRRLTYRVRLDAAGVVGGVLLLYALVAYPALAHALGHRYPSAPTFGLPCPTTIFTFGLLVWARPPVPRALVVIPALWAVVGTVAAVRLGMREDFGLLAGALVALPALLRRERRGRGRGVRRRPTEPHPGG